MCRTITLVGWKIIAPPIRQSLFSVPRQINKIYGTFRHDSYISRGMPAVKYDPSSLYNEGFQPSYFNFRSFATDGSFRWQYSVNSVNRPNYLAAEIEALGGVLNSENKLGTEAVTPVTAKPDLFLPGVPQ